MIVKFEDYKVKLDGWYPYKESAVLDIPVVKPPKNGLYKVKMDHLDRIRQDEAEYIDGEFKKSINFGLRDNMITHWKII